MTLGSDASRAHALRLAGVCAAATAFTTFLLWLLPRFVPPAADFAAKVALHENGWYLARLWVNFAHNWLALFGYIGAAAVLARRTPAFAVGGLAAFAIWATTELAGIAIIIVGVNGTWRARYGAAGEAERATLQTLLTGWDAVWDGMFFLLLVAFFIGSLLYGLAALRGRGLERLVGGLILAGAPLTLLIIIGGYTDAGWANDISDAIYPVLQPASRLLMGVWIWREAGSAERLTAASAVPANADRPGS